MELLRNSTLLSNSWPLENLSNRKQKILRHLISDYIANAEPVGSTALATNHRLGVSSATIRNEMVQLEEDGYILRPHTSAGGMPSDKGYRFFVERLLEDVDPPVPLGQTIQAEIEEVRGDVERWAKTASSVVSGVMRTFAFATAPRAFTSRVRRIELLHLRDLTALMVLILHGASVHKQLIPLGKPMTPAALEKARNRLTSMVADRTASEIESNRPSSLGKLDAVVIDATIDVLRANEFAAEDFETDGLSGLLAQPEFVETRHGRDLIGALEEGGALSMLDACAPQDGVVYVMIGSEIARESLHPFSVVVCRYGVAGQSTGTVGVIGPTRLEYERAIPVVNHAASLLSRLSTDLFPTHPAREAVKSY